MKVREIVEVVCGGMTREWWITRDAKNKRGFSVRHTKTLTNTLINMVLNSNRPKREDIGTITYYTYYFAE